MKVRVTKQAQVQIDRAALWWDQNRPLAPEALDEELAEAFSLLSTEPGMGATVSNVRAEGVGKWGQCKRSKKSIIKPEGCAAKKSH